MTAKTGGKKKKKINHTQYFDSSFLFKPVSYITVKYQWALKMTWQTAISLHILSLVCSKLHFLSLMPLSVFVVHFTFSALKPKLVLLTWILVRLVEQENVYWASLCPNYGNLNKETAAVLSGNQGHILLTNFVPLLTFKRKNFSLPRCWMNMSVIL